MVFFLFTVTFDGWFRDILPLLLSSSCALEGNIKAKWPSVCRKGIDSANRVVQLFTGYKGPRFCVEVLTYARTYLMYFILSDSVF